MAKNLKAGMLIVLESTTYPGTTEELVKPILEASGLRCGEDFFLAYSPERVDPGNKTFNTKNTPKVVGGVTPLCTSIAATLYQNVLDGEVHQVSSPAVAEMEKILENTFRNINIALANEMAILCNKMGIDVWEVIDAAATKPYGFMPFYPGPGLGGHCIPIDPWYLTGKAREERD
ncbi:nucleotide sugar dehydrogenase, partial [Proteus mirabilis]|uniref:nucleotide sugar dehydrogenase n=1 Tax=Proteus mirabilis TaxID=584 RepID=UPI00217CD027